MLFWLSAFEGVAGYQMADIAFVLADDALLQEIGVIAPVDKKPVEEKVELKEQHEQQDEDARAVVTLKN